jgi:hypothetical protein
MQASIILTNCVSLRQNRFMAWVSICSNWEGATGRLAGKAPPGRQRYKELHRESRERAKAANYAGNSSALLSVLLLSGFP